jgi:hypothetical protein
VSNRISKKGVLVLVLSTHPLSCLHPLALLLVSLPTMNVWVRPTFGIPTRTCPWGR